MQAVPAPASDRVIERQLQIIIAQKPVERRPGFAAPATVTGNPVRLQARRDSAGGFDRLLIEASLFATLPIKALRPDRYKVPVGLASLLGRQPIERFKAGGKHALIRGR